MVNWNFRKTPNYVYIAIACILLTIIESFFMDDISFWGILLINTTVWLIHTTIKWLGSGIR